MFWIDYLHFGWLRMNNLQTIGNRVDPKQPHLLKRVLTKRKFWRKNFQIHLFQLMNVCTYDDMNSRNRKIFDLWRCTTIKFYIVFEPFQWIQFFNILQFIRAFQAYGGIFLCISRHVHIDETETYCQLCRYWIIFKV